MIKKNKWTLLFSSLVILLPMLLGVLGKELLPPEFIIHWGADGTPDGMGGAKVFFILPPILLAIHWLCVLTSAVLDKNVEQSPKLYRIVFWIIPALSLFCHGMMVMTARGLLANPMLFLYPFLGILFIVIGNYLPKTKRNISAGIKIKWTLASDENWYATHRFGGRVYVATGFVCFAAMPLPIKAFPFVMLGIILFAALLPVIYSYRFYKGQLARGEVTRAQTEQSLSSLFKHKKAAVIVSVVLCVLLVTALPILMFTGSIELAATDTALELDASFGYALTLRYEDIESAEYREQGVDGERLYGFGSARLLLGTFQNEEFGTYERYTYTKNTPCIVLKAKGSTVVVGLEDAERLSQIYAQICEKIAQ